MEIHQCCAHRQAMWRWLRTGVERAKGRSPACGFSQTFPWRSGSPTQNTHHPLGPVLHPFFYTAAVTYPSLSWASEEETHIDLHQARNRNKISKFLPVHSKVTALSMKSIVTVDICVLSDARRGSGASREIEGFCIQAIFSRNRIEEWCGCASSKT